MAKVIARALGRGGRGVKGKGMKVCILDPRRIVRGHSTAHWNPFNEMARAIERRRIRNEAEREDARRHGETPPCDLPTPEDVIVTYAMKMADGLIVNYGRENPFWPNAAKDFLIALIIFVFLTEPPERRNLVRLYDLLCNGLPEKTPKGRSPFGMMLYEMTKIKAFGGIVAGSANTLAGLSEETRGSIVLTMAEQLQWLKEPAVRNICQSSSFGLDELKTGKLVLFLCAPVTDIRVEMAGWFRLITVFSLTIFEELQYEKSAQPCLFALDEFPSLGRINAIESSAAVMRSYGVRLLCIAQDIGQIRNLYDNWQTFLGSAAAVWYMAISDPETLAYLQKCLGQSRIRRTLGGGWWQLFSSERSRTVEDEHAVMTCDQIERFLSPRRGNMIVQRSGDRPLKLKVAPYFKTLPVWAYEHDDDHPEARLRAVTRWWLKRRQTRTKRSVPPELPSTRLLPPANETDAAIPISGS